MSAILTNIGDVLDGIFTMLTTMVTNLTANPYFLFAITLCLTVTVIGIALKFLKSFGLKRGSKRRGR